MAHMLSIGDQFFFLWCSANSIHHNYYYTFIIINSRLSSHTTHDTAFFIDMIYAHEKDLVGIVEQRLKIFEEQREPTLRVRLTVLGCEQLRVVVSVAVDP
jgi:hypothetical protein